MKRLIILLLFTFFVGVNLNVYAHISERRDDFDESNHIKSYNDINPFDGIGLKKIVTKNKSVQYIVSLSSDVSNKEQIYSKKNVKIKIDDEIFEIKVLSSFQYSKSISTCEVELPVELASKLIKAQEVSMRFFRNNGLANTLSIPNSILSEWKQVISTEK